MRVALDARKLEDFGIGTYIQGLVEGFLALDAPETLVLYLPPGPTPPWASGSRGRLECRPVRARPYSLGELWQLARAARRDHAELFHAPHYVCPPLLPCPAVVTIHDLIHLRFPAPHRHPLAPLYARVMLRLAVRRAARLVTVSESTRRDLEDLLGAPGERIRVIPNGVGARFQPARDPSALARSLGHLAVAPPYWLFVGNPLPHKNLEGLLDAVSGLDPGLGGLVVVGVRPAARARVDAAVARRQLGPRVRILAPVTEDVLPVLYQGALALVMPSLWEGFGLPVVEAMACGTPVIASDRGALPEVLGGVGLSVDPLNVDALREALYSVAVDRSVGAALSAAGLARARAFSWHAAAEATLAVYREVLGS